MTKSVQISFLEELKKSNSSVTVFLVNGIKLQGLVTFFDDEALLLRRDGHTQLVYRHAISTIMPSTLIDIVE